MEDEIKQINETELMDIPIDKIKSLSNSRIRIDHEDLAGFM